MIITDVGMNAILQSETSGYVYKIAIGAIKLGALNTNLGTGATDVPGGPVYTFNSNQISYSEQDSAGTPSKYILIKTELGADIGGFSYGSVGVYLESGDLFAYDIFPIYPKLATNLPTVNGDIHRRFYGLVCKNITDMLTLDYAINTLPEYPSVATEDLLPDPDDVPYALYIVASTSTLANRPSLAYSNGTVWTYTSLDQQGLAGIDVSPVFTGTPIATGENSLAFGNSTIQGNNAISFGDSKGIGDKIFIANTGNATTSYGDDLVVMGDRNSGGLTSDRHHNLVVGGSQHQAGANYVAILGGEGHKANADYTTLIGKRAKTTTKGESAYAAGMFSREGDAQHSQFILKGITVTTDSSEIFSDTNGRLFIEIDSAIFYYGKLMMVRPGNLIYVWDVTIKAENTVENGVLAALTLTPRVEYSTPSLAVLSLTTNNLDNTIRLSVAALNANSTRWVLDLAATRIMW